MLRCYGITRYATAKENSNRILTKLQTISVPSDKRATFVKLPLHQTEYLLSALTLQVCDTLSLRGKRSGFPSSGREARFGFF